MGHLQVLTMGNEVQYVLQSVCRTTTRTRTTTTTAAAAATTATTTTTTTTTKTTTTTYKLLDRYARGENRERN